MDILLIEPPPTNKFGNMRQFGSIGTYKASIAYPPIDLMKIAGTLREAGFQTRLYDANTMKASVEEVVAIVREETPRLVVFTTSTTALINDMEMARRIKEESPAVITATFGAHIKGAPEQTLKEFAQLDVAIYGDQEYVVRELARNGFNLCDTKGICYRSGDSIIRNELHPPVVNLDEYGIAAHDMIDPKLYHDPFAKRRPLTITYGQIGCINKCTYCMSTLYGGLRFRTVTHFMEELKLIAKLGFREVFFIDCGFTNNLKWANALMDSMIENSLGLTWWCLSRADHLDEQIMKKMKAAGCHSIGVGVENANAEVIKNIKKRVDTERVLDVVRTAHRIGMRVLLYFQFGLPGETRETMQNTLDFALKSGADLVTFGIATPVPGTEFYNYIKENNFFITDDWRKFDPILPPVYSYPNLNSEEIFEFSQKAYKKFYMRPSFIVKRFTSQRSLHEIKNNFENFVNFIGRFFMSKKNKNRATT